jgi:hypothetical protein
MRCDRAQELFSDYCEGSVPTAMLIPFEDHLQGCSQCRHDVEGLRGVWQMLDTAPMVEPPATFRAAVWARIEAEEAARQKRKPRVALPSFNWSSLFSRPAMAWGAAGLAVILLAPFAMPGQLTQARGIFPWSLLPGALTSTGPRVSVSQPTVIVQDNRPGLSVHIANGTASAVDIQLAVEGGVNATVTAPVGFNGTRIVPLAAMPAGPRLNATATWTEAGKRHSRNLIAAPQP